MSIKDVRIVRSQGGSGFVVQCGQGEFFRCGRPRFLEQKTSLFSKYVVCPHGQEGLNQCR